MTYRGDIQALRGIAVLLVVAYHYHIPPIPAGYLGVDVFFVISGFLITSIIRTSLRNGEFSFYEFYLRRAWRLFPAAYTVFFISILVAPFILTANQLVDIRAQIFGAITFTANFVLWSQSGYFETAAEAKPLLHTWSLAIEEQYYAIIPLLLVLVKLRNHLPLILTLTGVSLTAMLIVGPYKPGATFYLTLFRVWELGIGSALAILVAEFNWRTPKLYGQLALIALLVLCIHPATNTLSVGLANLLAVLCASLVISSRLSVLSTSKQIQPLLWVGTISYSLYLIHWPIISYLNSANLSGTLVWWPLRLASLVVSFALSVLSYYYIEQKFRVTEHRKAHSVWWLALITLALLIFSNYWVPGSQSNSESPGKTSGLSGACDSEHALITKECRTGENASVLLWGDSYAMHLAPGMKSASHQAFQQATMASCAPVPGLGKVEKPKYSREWAQSCIEFNSKVLDYAIRAPQLTTVILASHWQYLLDPKNSLLVRDISNRDQLVRATDIDLTSRINDLVQTLRNADKKVVFVATPPAGLFDLRKCVERKSENLPLLSGTPDCNIDRRVYRQQFDAMLRMVNRLEQVNVPIFRFEPLLCTENICSATLNDVILYADNGHFSAQGSRELQTVFEFYQALLNLAQ